MGFLVDHSLLVYLTGHCDSAVRYAAEAFARDVALVVGNNPDIIESATSEPTKTDRPMIVVDTAAAEGPPWEQKETYTRHIENNARVLRINATDPLGAVYGLFDISREFLGIDPFWFWTGHRPPQRSNVEIDVADYCPPSPSVRLRGWFVNGEDLLTFWQEEYPIPNEIWEKIYETILRCNGNLVIPGTDVPRHSPHWELAANMGLWQTHHHVEVLGAEMFGRAFPELEARYDLHRDKFIQLYHEAIERQKNWKVVWALGFRGQGDCPFWQNDSRYKTPSDRGQLLSDIITEQYELVVEYAGTNNAATCVNIYGEMAALYHDGHLRLPDDTIRIWGDNGYGVMVSRRQDLDNPRTPALPTAKESDHQHGLYYHVNFHDLQASNQLTMLPSPDLTTHQLSKAIQYGADSLVIVNSGNIRPHILTLGLVMELLNNTPHDDDMQKLTEVYLESFGTRHFGNMAEEAMACYKQYFDSLWSTGKHKDEKAGDEIYYWTAKYLLQACLRSCTQDTISELTWATPAAKSFAQQVQWFADHTAKGQISFDNLWRNVQTVHDTFTDKTGQRFFKDNIMMQVRLHQKSNAGLHKTCLAVQDYCSKRYKEAFLNLSHAIRDYEAVLQAMRETEHGHWKNWYRGDCLTDVAETIRQLRVFRSYVRGVGDTLFRSWMGENLPEREQSVRLSAFWRRPKDDDEMAFIMENLEKMTLPMWHKSFRATVAAK